MLNNSIQNKDESFDYFVSDLEKLIKSCEYETQEESILTDRIIIGISDTKLRESLLNISDLTLQKAIETCRAAEITKIEVRNMQEKEIETVNIISRNKEN